MFLHVFVIITHYGPLDLNTTCDALSLQLRAGHAGSKLILFTNHLWNYIDGWQPSLARPETLKEHILLFNIVWFHKHHTRSARTERKQKGWNDTVRSFRWCCSAQIEGAFACYLMWILYIYIIYYSSRSLGLFFEDGLFAKVLHLRRPQSVAIEYTFCMRSWMIWPFHPSLWMSKFNFLSEAMNPSLNGPCSCYVTFAS